MVASAPETQAPVRAGRDTVVKTGEAGPVRCRGADGRRTLICVPPAMYSTSRIGPPALA